MLKENGSLTDALIQLINAMPESEREKITRLITKRKRRTVRKEKKEGETERAKNYDARKIASLLDKIKKKKIFQKVQNPSGWQRKLRDDWE